jgi:hypothetical protein
MQLDRCDSAFPWSHAGVADLSVENLCSVFLDASWMKRAKSRSEKERPRAGDMVANLS